MPNYRLYRIDRHTGHFIGMDEIHAGDDVSAIHEVQQRVYATSIELWEGGRKVTRVDALPEAAAFQPRPLGQPLH